jgi:hypothetical protein
LGVLGDSHEEQSDKPVEDATLFSGQVLQLVDPTESAYFPLLQGVQTDFPTFALYLPGGQSEHTETPTLEYLPLTQLAQEVAFSALFANFPAAQEVHPSNPALALYLPTSQPRQKKLEPAMQTAGTGDEGFAVAPSFEGKGVGALLGEGLVGALVGLLVGLDGERAVGFAVGFVGLGEGGFEGQLRYAYTAEHAIQAIVGSGVGIGEGSAVVGLGVGAPVGTLGGIVGLVEGPAVG